MMPDLCPIVAAFAFAYSAALLGVGAALFTTAWFGRSRRAPSALEAAWCALLPLVAIGVLVTIAVYEPHALVGSTASHDLWHLWAERLHQIPASHGTLHAANAASLCVLAICLGRTAYALSRAQAFGSGLRFLSSDPLPDVANPAVYCLPSDKALCFTVGVLRPRVYLTTGLRERLSPRERDAVLAHEAAHVRRRDGLLSVVLVTFYNLFPLPGGWRLYHGWVASTERACDAEAARSVGSSCDVAAALVTVARLAHSQTLPGAASFAASRPEDVAARVQALLEHCPLAPRALARHRIGLAVLAALSFSGLLAAYPVILHLAEMFAYH